MEKNIYQKNIGLLYVYSVLIKRVSMPIIVLYYLANNLNFTQIGILASVAIGVSLVLDIQGGIFADTYGKKWSLVAHSVFGFLAALFLFVGNSFGLFLISGVLFGISSAFVTGTENSFLYDTLICMGKEKEFKKYKGKNTLYTFLVSAVFLSVIPVIYEYNHKLPFLIVMIFYILSIAVAVFFVEPEASKKRKEKFHLYGKKLFESLREIKHKRELKYFIVWLATVAAFMYFSSEFVQPLLKMTGLDIIYFGIVYAVMRVCFGFGSFWAHKIEKYFSSEKLLFIAVLLVAGILFAMGFGWGVIIVLAILSRSFVAGVVEVFFDDEINKMIESENRTTILSVKSFLGSILKIGLMIVFGVVADWLGVQEMFVIASVIFMIFSGVIFAMKNRVSKVAC